MPPPPPHDRSKVRLTVDIPCVIDRRIQDYADRSGVTKTEAIRMALRMLTETEGLAQQGYSVGAWRENAEGKHDTVKFVNI